MATGSNSRDVRLGIQIETAGEDELRRSADELRKLAKAGTDGADDLARFAAQFDRLAEQRAAITTLQSVAAAVDKLTADQRDAAAATEALSARLREAQAAAAPLAQRQQELAESTAAARRAQVDAQAALTALRTEYDAAGKKTAEFTSEQSRLVAAIGDARRTIAANNEELTRLKPALTEAATAERTLSQQYDKSATTLAAAEAALRDRNRALDSARASALAAGVATEDLAAAENLLLAAARATATEVQRVAAARREAAAQAAALAELDAANAAALERQQRALIEVATAYDREQQAVTQAAVAAREKAAADEAAARAAAENAAAQRSAALAAAQADAEFRNTVLSLRAAAQAAEALAATESDNAMRALEQAAAAADAEMRDLAASLRDAEKAAAEYAAATERVAAASQDDVVATQTRIAAAQRLIESERALSAAARELAALRDRNRGALIAEAEALSRAAAAARESQAATVAAAQAARQAGAAIEQAFGATGVRSIEAIEKEIEQTGRALVKLTLEAKNGGIGLDDLERAAGAAAVKINRLQQEILQIQAVPGVFERVSGSLNDLITRFGALTAVVGTLGVAIRPAVESFIALEASTRILTSITGSATQAAEQIEFLRRTAQNSGQSFDALAQTYSKFAASALQTGLSLQDTQAVFGAVSNAAGNLGLSSDQAGRALEALSQIASKGVVSMEELRGQLGDAIPGVLPALARELGLTNAELNKVVESGNLAAFEAIPALGRAISTLGTEGGKPVEGLVAEFNRLKNVVLETTNTLAEGAIGRALGATLGVLSEAIQRVAFGVATIGESFTVVGRQIGTVVAAVVTRDFKNLGDALAQIEQDSTRRLAGLAERIQGTGTAASGAAGPVRALGESLSKVSLAQAEAVSSAELLTRTRETLAQAAEKELEATAQLIGIVDDDAEAAQRSADATERVAIARRAAAAAAAAEVDSLRAARQAVIDKAGSDEQARKGIEATVKALDDKIVKATADAEKSQASADKAVAVAEASRLAAAAIGDQSAKYGELAVAVENAQRAYDAVLARFRDGKATTQEVTAADTELVKAKRLLRDASNDQNDASKRTVDALKAEAEFTKAQIELEIARLRVKQQDLQQRGLVSAAQRLGNDIADLELQLTVRGTEAKRAQATETIRATALRIAELDALGQLTPAMRQELETRIRQQQAILLQADASVVNEQQRARENEGVRNGTLVRGELTRAVNEGTTATQSNTGAVGSNTNALQANAQAASQAATAQQRYNQSLRDDPLRLVGGNGLAGIPNPAGPGIRDPNTTNMALDPARSGRTPSTTRVAVGTTGPRNINTGSNQGFVGGIGAFGRPPGPEDVPAFTVPEYLVPANGQPPLQINVTIGGRVQTVTAMNRSEADRIIALLEAAYAAGGG